MMGGGHKLGHRRGFWHRGLAVAAVLVLGGLLGACNSSNGQGGDIEGTHWLLRSYISSGTKVDVPDAVFADVAFDRVTVSGFNACNDFSGGYTTRGSSLSFGQFAATAMACPEAETGVATGYMAALGNTASYTATTAALTLFDKNGTRLAEFVTAPANPLVGGDWMIDSYLDATGSVVKPVEGSKPSVTFVEGGKVSGATGCNTFAGAYSVSGDTLLIGRLVITQMACSDTLAAQEKAIVTALTGASAFTVRSDTLVLRDPRGVATLFAARVGGPNAPASPLPTASPAPSATPGPTPSPTPSPAPSPTPSQTPSPSPSAPPSPTPSQTPSPSPSAPPSQSPMSPSPEPSAS